jgi:Fe-S-cluster containining protein
MQRIRTNPPGGRIFGDGMSGVRKNGHAHGANGAAVIEVPDVHPATFNPRTRNGRSHGAVKGKRRRGRAKTAKPTLQYNCAKCPGYCCSYPVIQVSTRDLTRLAKYFKISEEDAEKRYCKSQHGYKRIFRRKKDEHFGMTCQFFDTERRCCTIYEGRPAICRSYPGTARCGYYDFLSFERRAQNDPEFVALTDHA